MRRGQVRWADLDPVRGSEADNNRPVVVVSNDRSNAAAERLGRGVVTVVPLTTNVRRVLPFQVLLPTDETGLAAPSKAQAEQVRSIAVQRIGTITGSLGDARLAEVDAALRLHLAL